MKPFNAIGKVKHGAVFHLYALPQGDPRADPDHAGEIMFLS